MTETIESMPTQIDQLQRGKVTARCFGGCGAASPA